MVKTIKKSTQQSSSRPPVVAVLGHVDHGKTSLLDAIRKTNIAAREHGGITQAIGAYQIETQTLEGKRKITFIDTPGHEAFSKMRSRGASAADIAILVVAADDGVMPQTKEAISHIKAAKIPAIVAITKSDLQAADPQKVKRQLAKEDVVLEGQGGDTPVVLVSSKTGKGIPDLLEVILLVAQMGNIVGDPKGTFEGVVIEAKRDRRKGILATVIVKNGKLAVGEEVHAEGAFGKVRALLSDSGQNLKEAGPATPVEVLGFSNIPQVGARVTKSRETGEIAIPPGTTPIPSSEPKKKRLAVILKADTQGSLEAIKEAIPQDDVTLILVGSGDPTEADVLLAKAANALIVGFNVTPSSSVLKLAETDGVIVKIYKLIYELHNELEEVITLFKEGGSLPVAEMILGKAQVLAIFPYEKKKVAGCKVLEGRVARGDKVRVERDGLVLGEAWITSIRRGKEEVGKATAGSECGILLSSSLDFEPSDVILSVR